MRDPWSVSLSPVTRSQRSCSVSTSSALDRSSHTSSSGSRISMRAAALRCTCPPESRTPRGPTTVSSPCSSAATSGSSTAWRTAACRGEVASPSSPSDHAHQDVLAQRRAEQPRHLRRVGAVRRPEELGRRRHRLAVPADLAAILGQQAQDGAQQRRLAGPDLPRDHREGAAGDAEAHVTHAAVAAGVEAGQVANVQEDGLVTRAAMHWLAAFADSNSAASL